ncbi:hypothetical protein HanRHA438_Chr13g0622571 [Helianthus annuus]|nr:hypothetical protein HanRHA438_Chr13g0622571 [Helianthus annuus]
MHCTLCTTDLLTFIAGSKSLNERFVRRNSIEFKGIVIGIPSEFDGTGISISIFMCLVDNGIRIGIRHEFLEISLTKNSKSFLYVKD